MADIQALIAALRAKGAADAEALAKRAIAGQATAEELLSNMDKIPTWRLRDYSDVPVGKPYKWNGKCYQLAKQHPAAEDARPDLASDRWTEVLHGTPEAIGT